MADERGRLPHDRLDKFLSKFAVKVDAKASSLSGTVPALRASLEAVRGRTARPPTRAGSAPITREWASSAYLESRCDCSVSGGDECGCFQGTGHGCDLRAA